MIYYLIGDAHIGRKFTRGVPLHRRGDRENLFKEELTRRLKEGEEKQKTIVLLGDLFNKYRVGFADLLWMADNLNKTNAAIIILAGNHDRSKNTETLGNLDILKRIIKPHVIIIDKKAAENQSTLFVPYGADLPETGKKYDLIFGHFEEEDYPEVEKHLTDNGQVYVGHIHKPGQVGRVTQVGSILPLAFGEEVEPNMMLTLTKEEIEATPNVWEDKCLRVIGKELPININCLQLIPYTGKKVDEDDSIEVEVGEYDLEEMFHEALDDLDLFEEFYNLYLEGRCLEN